MSDVHVHCDDQRRSCETKFEMLHEKVNARPTWLVFWSIVLVMNAAITGAFVYTKSTSDDQRRFVEKTEMAELKADMKEIKSDIRAMLQERRK
jgi:uncharacterized membrane protein (DUF106 family)